MFTRTGKNYSDCVEVAAYRTSAEAKAAFDEFVATPASCRAKVKRAPQGTMTFNRVSADDSSSADGIRSETAILREGVMIAATTQKLHGWTSGIVLQRGQFLVILWTGQQRPYTDTDLDILRTIVDDESLVLGATPLS